MTTSRAPIRQASVAARVVTLRNGRWGERADRLAGEEPLEVRVAGPRGEPQRVAVTMRTPGNDFALAVGLLVAEGIIAPGDVARVSYCTGLGAEQAFNTVLVRSHHALRAEIAMRAFDVSSSCGVCGKTSLDDVVVRCGPVTDDLRVSADVILSLPDRMREAQRAFARTGSVHAAGLFAPDGTAVTVIEDVGRHNAVDKVVGWTVLEGWTSLAGHVLMVSSRLSFEIIQKAAVAGVPVVCAVSGPSSLAVRTANALGITAVGFVRGRNMNIYTHPDRVDREA